MGPYRRYAENVHARQLKRVVWTGLRETHLMRSSALQVLRRARPATASRRFISQQAGNNESRRVDNAGSPDSSSSSNHERTTHFGFQTVPEDAKETLVKGVFSNVASNYDLMNDAMSMGVHRLWKDTFVGELDPGRRGPIRVLDVAGGTGDIALRILDHAREKYADRETTVEVLDINPEMLAEGKKRFKKTMYHNSE